MTIKILHQYHNNMLDTYLALRQVADVEFLSYRISKLLPTVENRVPKTYGKPPIAYDPISLWNFLKRSNYVFLKHINNPLNAIPLALAPIIRFRPIIVVQKIAHPSFPGYNLLFRILCWYLDLIEAKIVTVTLPAYKELHFQLRKVIYLPAAVNCSRFQVANFKPQNQLHILTVGKFQKRKHLSMLLRGFYELTKEHPLISMKLTIIANKTSEPISVGEEDRIRAYIQAHNLEEKVTVLQNINYDDIPAHYASAHLFILPASHEPLGYSVVEAMAAGLPVITSADAGAASYVKNGQNGYTFTPKSKTELKKVIKKFFSNNTINWRKLQKIGKQNRRVATQHHDPQKWVSLCKN